MLLSTLTDYTVGHVLARTTDERRRKHFFALSLVVNLGVLAIFKYVAFFSDSVERLLGHAGLHADFPTLHVLLPVGISFYTFHGISYTFDVYRRQLAPATDLLSFAVFVAYFPQLVAGPIGRAHLQLPQFERPRRRPTTDEVRSALALILMGLVKKVVIADGLAGYVNSTFSNPDRMGSVRLLTATYAFALQIYGDFAGYSDIARGSSRLLGIELIRNFEQPYLSRSITEFWHRWHISLSTWLRDYLYVPLGGNRRGPRRTYLNLFLTMLLGGLWHGAAWTFVIWGALHGGYLAAERLLRVGQRDATRPWSPRRDLLPTVVTLHLVCVAWVFFRARTLDVALGYLGGVVAWRPGPVGVDNMLRLVVGALLVLVLDLAQRRVGRHSVLVRLPTLAQGVAVGACVVAVILFSGGTPVPFIYFQF
jgi:D-alanyl-lipoteichoic acid acyltransferase DltB (MBOAT superfamily)